ncbi:MAG TPA: hypothetical protein VJ779_15505 [Acetobacteraceae bacterium]|nr:hypothetical protein [Acetobacteraceae bacterium]
MTFETYWLIVPLAGIGLSVFGWLALWLTRKPRRTSPFGADPDVGGRR